MKTDWPADIQRPKDVVWTFLRHQNVKTTSLRRLLDVVCRLSLKLLSPLKGLFNGTTFRRGIRGSVIVHEWSEERHLFFRKNSTRKLPSHSPSHMFSDPLKAGSHLTSWGLCYDYLKPYDNFKLYDNVNIKNPDVYDEIHVFYFISNIFISNTSHCWQKYFPRNSLTF